MPVSKTPKFVPNSSIPKVKAPVGAHSVRTAYSALNLALPSDRLLYALKALDWFEGQKKVRVNMAAFHDVGSETPSQYPANPVCIVCLAGATALKLYSKEVSIQDCIANKIWGITGFVTLMASKVKERKTPITSLLDEVTKLEFSIDSIRRGQVQHYLLTMGVSLHMSKVIARLGVEDYHINPDQFKCDLRAVVRYLQSLGF